MRKTFETVLPELPDDEVRFYFGLLYRIVEDNGWKCSPVLPEAVMRWPVLDFKAEKTHVGRSATEVLRLSLRFLGSRQNREIHVNFDQNASPDTLETERQIGQTMKAIDNVLRKHLNPNATKLWVMSAGQWSSGIHFSG